MSNEKEKSKKVNPEDTISSKVTVSVSCVSPCDKDAPDVTTALSFPMRSLKETEALFKDNEVLNPGTSEAFTRWLECFKDARDNYVAGDSFTKCFERATCDWRQYVDIDSNKFTISAASSARGANSGKLSGDSAVLKINSALNIGAIVKVPLWHSGLWLTLKAPSSSAQIVTDRLLANDKLILGRQTNGMVFSNVSVYLRKTLIDLALGCVISSNVVDSNRELLLELIKVTDYNTLIWAMACAIHPNGYRLMQPCVNDVTKCNHVTNELVSLTKLSWTDNYSLTSEQRKHMSDRGLSKKSKESILEYQASGIWMDNKGVKLSDKLTVNLKVPNMNRDLLDGVRWVDSTVEAVNETFNDVDLDDKTRNVRIAEQAKATTLRQYSGWIESIVISGSDEEDAIIDDRGTIDQACESLTSDNDICESLFKEIGDYIDASMISLIGIPTYECPKCSSKPSGSNKYNEIIPLAMDEIFFTLIRQWTIRIINQKNMF